jgi:hypothetical protein
MWESIAGILVALMVGVMVAIASVFLFLGVTNLLWLFLFAVLITSSILLIYFGLMARPPAIPPAPIPVKESVVQKVEPETVYLVAKLELPDGRVLPITSIRQVFGRANFATYLTPEILNTISRNHFTIFFRGGKFYIEDAGSTNGTLLNNKEIRATGPNEIKDGDVISPAGVVSLRFKI